MILYLENSKAFKFKLKTLIYLAIASAVFSCSEEPRPPGPQTPPVAVTDTLVIGVTSRKSQLTMSSDTINVLRNDYDPENDQLSIDIVSGSGTYGNASIVDDSSIAYNPEKSLFKTFNEPREDNIHYNLTDGTYISQGELIIHFKENLCPFAQDDYISVVMNTSIIFQPFANDNDPDGDNLSVKLLTPPKNGEIILFDSVFNSGFSLAYMKYKPKADYYGQDSLTYLSIDVFNCPDTARVYFDVER